VSAECPRNLFTGRSDQDAFPLQDVRETGTDSRGRRPVSSSSRPSSQIGVREPSATPETHQDDRERSQRPAHPPKRLVAQFSATWRVVDDPLQWVLQQKKGNPRAKNSGWRGRSFCRTREVLLRCIREYCGEIDALALAKLKSLPDWHPDWDRRDDRTNLDVRGTDQAHANGQSKSLIPKAVEDSGAGAQPARSSEPALSLFVSQGD